jgi:Trk K+ transport system NAD-binding subunit
MLDRIVVVGAGRTGESLLQRLATIAPVVVLDTSPAALDVADAAKQVAALPLESPEGAGAARVHEVRKKNADGTSRLVLSDLRGRAEDKTALVAATGEDRTNLEICRLGMELAFRPVVAVAIDPAAAAGYEALGARAIVRATLLGDVVERALRYDGVAAASTIGLGQGDAIEVRVLPTSPFIGARLSQLRPVDWRVAAIYRGGRLVLPTGAATIEPEDRVLLVGDPSVLPRIAEDLRVGVPDFPLRFGPNVVAFLPDGADASVQGIAAALGAATKARAVEHITGARGEPMDTTLARLADARPGVVVSAPRRRALGARLIGSSGLDGRLCDGLEVPVLFTRAAPPYARVVYVAAAGLPGLRVADVAIDLARLMRVPLAIVVVELPSYFGAGDTPLEQVVAGVVKRAELHRLSPEVVRAQGNPIAEVESLARPGDLLVVTRRRGQRDSFSSPDVALRIARDGRAPTLVFTGRP